MGDRRPLPVVLALLGGWAIVAPFADGALGFDVATRTSVEVVDHVIPGVVVVLGALLVARSRTARLPASLIVVLAGLWMTATHVPLLRESGDASTSTGAAVWHTAPGVATLVVGLLLVPAALRTE